MKYLHTILSVDSRSQIVSLRIFDVQEEICSGQTCHRFGKVRAPLDYDDPSQGEHDLVYFVNSDFWDPINKPNAPIFIIMSYGSVEPTFVSYSLAMINIPNANMPGVDAAFAREMGALIINVPNRYYGCESARAGNRAGSCPTSLEPIPEGDEGVLEALHRLRFLSAESVVDDIAFVADQTITTFAEDWGMVIPAGKARAPNRPITFGCSWPGAAAVYSRMKHPDLFPGAVATSHPLVSSPNGNPHYRSFVGHVYELAAAGGSLECRNVLTVGHQEIRRRIQESGVRYPGPIGSCQVNCIISAQVNRS